jgi:hypothetical protein
MRRKRRGTRMESDACPRCGSREIVAGCTNRVEAPEAFRPLLKHDLRYWLSHFNGTRGVELREQFVACLSCGLVWGQVSPEELRAFMSKEYVLPPRKPKEIEPEL